MSTTVVVALRTAGSGQTVIGSALTYSVSYDASGAAVRAVATSAALPGIVAAGFSLTLGDIAVPAHEVTLIGGSAPATATRLRASSDGLRRLAHGALELTVFAHRTTGAATASASQLPPIDNACTYAQMTLDNTRTRVGELSLQLAELAAPDPDTDALFGKPDAFELALLRQQLEQAQQNYVFAQWGVESACGPDEPGLCPTSDSIFDGDACNPGGPVAVDPSGYVRTRAGVPIEKARVVLERSDTARGPYVALPNGDQQMAPNNRRNPDMTDIDGHFGWDVFPGFYRVKATRKGCRGSDTSRGLPVPPPVTNLRLTLSCPNLHRAVTRTRILSVHRRGPSTVVTVQVSSRRRPTGTITLSAPGLRGSRAFVDARHPRATLVLAGHPRKRARLVVRYAGNARWSPSRAQYTTRSGSRPCSAPPGCWSAEPPGADRRLADASRAGRLSRGRSKERNPTMRTPCRSPAAASRPRRARPTGSPATSTSTRSPHPPARRRSRPRSCTSPPAPAPPGTPIRTARRSSSPRAWGLCQREDGPVEIIRPGDRVFFEPGENHWHGAAPTRFMVHVAIQQNDDPAARSRGASTSPTRSTRPLPRPPPKRGLTERPSRVCSLGGMPAAPSPAPEPNRWAVLALLGVAQLMVVLDSTIVNIALPSAQADLGFSTENRQWVVTAYALAFGSLLLVGGKLGDLFGRKWTFIGGLIGFSIASFLGGLAPSFGVLVAARALQGAFGALLAPSALSLLTVTFADSPDAAQGVRHLRRGGDRRRVGRPAARRRPHRRPLVALVPLRQPASSRSRPRSSRCG